MALATDERLAWLRGVPLFRGCSDASMASLADRTAEVDFRDGQYIVQQGQVGNGLFVLVSGSAQVVTGDRVLARLGPGEVIGELSVIDQEPRAASVVAEGQVGCLALASWDVLALLETDPRLAHNLLLELAQRLRAANVLIGH